MKTKVSSKKITNRLINILDYYLYHIVIKKDYKKSFVNGSIHHDVIQETNLIAA